jgi:hypothetical protein
VRRFIYKTPVTITLLQSRNEGTHEIFKIKIHEGSEHFVFANSLNRLFPFYLFLTPDFENINFGSSLGKICQDLSNNALFTTVFKITRPQLDLISFQVVVALQ